MKNRDFDAAYHQQEVSKVFRAASMEWKFDLTMKVTIKSRQKINRNTSKPLFVLNSS